MVEAVEYDGFFVRELVDIWATVIKNGHFVAGNSQLAEERVLPRQVLYSKIVP
jgi:hypothetical protein